jgi:LmbE family N-acetylglucosaminyl deacetylase
MKPIAPALSPLTRPEILPLHSIATIATDRALIVAPHPDDEALGCAGAIAMLRARGSKVRILVTSDGAQSHPNSCKYPAPALRSIRKNETLAAMQLLGVEKADITFMQLPDSAVPSTESPTFNAAAALCHAYLAATAPQLLILPWRNDSHPDHRATWQLFAAALARCTFAPRTLEYPIWDWDLDRRRSIATRLLTPWRLDISPVVDLKQQAIAAYRSQIADLIDDDPTGFRLSPEMLANFAHPWEIYLESDRAMQPIAV